MPFTLAKWEDKQRWDNFVCASPQANIFCTTQFLDALLEEYDLLMVEENGRSQIGAVVLKHDGSPTRAPYPFTMYQGILFDQAGLAKPFHKRLKWQLDVVESLLAALERLYDRISFCIHYAVEDMRSFQWFHYHTPELGQFRIDLRYTGLLDLQTVPDFNHYLGTVRSVRRQEYRYAQEKGLSTEVSTDVGLLSRLHRMTFDRQGITQSTEEERLLLSIAEASLKNGFGRLLVCRDGSGNAASATLFLYDAHCGYYLFGGNDPDYRKTGAGTYLVLENIKWCMENRLSRVDFVGINSPNRGDFKTSFNAAPRPYFIVTWERP
jgi:hypothetical protein